MMFTKTTYERLLKKSIIGIKVLTDPVAQATAMEIFKKILSQSCTNNPVKFTEIGLLALKEFHEYVDNFTEADKYNVSDFLVTKAEFFKDMKIDLFSIMYPDELMEVVTKDLAAAPLKGLVSALEQPPVEQAAATVEASSAMDTSEAAEEGTVLSAISGNGPDGTPYFLPAQRQVIVGYIRTRLEFVKTGPLDPNKRILKARLEELQRSFAETSPTGFSVDSENDPAVFMQIQKACQDLEKTTKIQMICRVISDYAADELNSLPPQDFIKLHTQVTALERELEAVNNMLKYFIQDQAKLQSPLPNITFTAQCSPGARTLDSAKFTLEVPNISMGYCIYNLLLISKQLASAANMPEVYEGAKKFEISREEFANLKKYLAELKIWYRDFNAILHSILGKDVERYTKTGQKSLKEIIKIEQTRRSRGLAAAIAPTTLSSLETMDLSSVVLLIGQVALDLTQHPDRENLKSLFESLYRNHDLIDAKGETKTFIKGRGLEFVSLLGIANIQDIYSDLMAQAGLTTIAAEMGYSSAASQDFLSVLGAETPIEAYNLLLTTRLAGLPILPLEISSRELISNKATKSVVRNIAALVNLNPAQEAQDYSVLANNFNIEVKKMLNRLCSVSLQASASEEPELTAAQRQRLFLSTISGAGAVKTAPETIDEFVHLFRTFESSDVYQEITILYEQHRQNTLSEGGVCKSLAECMEVLKKEFRTRSQEYQRHGSAYNGLEPMMIAAGSLIQSVARMYYNDVTGITYKSMVDYFLTFAELDYQSSDSDGRDMKGCDRGFAGRMESAAAHLESEHANYFKVIQAQLIRSTADKISNRILRVGSESSMAFVQQPHIWHELGLRRDTGVGRRDEPRIQKFFVEFAKEYNPGTLYQEFYNAYINNFKVHAANEDHAEITTLLQSLGFNLSEIVKFHVNPEDPSSKWSLSKFIVDLPNALIQTLILQDVLNPQHGKKDQQGLVTATGRCVPFAISVAPAARANPPTSFFPAPEARANPLIPAPASSARPVGAVGLRATQLSDSPTRRGEEAVRNVSQSQLTDTASKTSHM